MADPTTRFRQTISYAVLTGRDAYGKPTLGSVSTAKARVQPKQRLIRTADGSEQMASHVIYTATAITSKHRVWFPGDSTANFNLARRPIEIDPMVDGNGAIRFYKVWF